MTVLKNDNNAIPVQGLDSLRIASVSFGTMKKTAFQETLDLYAGITHFNLPVNASEIMVKTLEDQLQNYDLVISGIHDFSKFPRNTLRLHTDVLQLIKDLASKENSIFAFFKNPYVLNKIDGIENAAALVVAYQDSKETQEVAAQLIFGGIGANGKLPVSVGDKFKAGEGLEVKGGIRL